MLLTQVFEDIFIIDLQDLNNYKNILSIKWQSSVVSQAASRVVTIIIMPVRVKECVYCRKAREAQLGVENQRDTFQLT